MHAFFNVERARVYVYVRLSAKLEIFGNFAFYYGLIIDNNFKNATLARLAYRKA